MFYDCEKFENINIFRFYKTNVKIKDYMFSDCKNLVNKNFKLCFLKK